MSSVVAIVKRVVGQVVAVSPEGIQRVLIEGDRLFTGDQVLTGLAGAVTLELADGRTIDLGRESQWSADTPTSTTDLEEATAQAAPSVEELQQAIAAGADPTKDLEATAAGPQSEGSGAPGGGHSVVMLDATAAVVAPTIGYETEGLNFGASLNSQFTGTTASDIFGPPITENLLSLSGSAFPSEAEDGYVFATLSTRTQSEAVTVTLSNGYTIVIPPFSFFGQVQVPFSALNDVYAGRQSVTFTIAGFSPATAGGLPIVASQTPWVADLNDSIDTTFAKLTADSSATEGGLITYTATLSNPPLTPISLTLSNGAEITIAAGETSGSVQVRASNDVYNGATATSVTLNFVNGTGEFERLELDKTPAVTTITDSIDNTTVTLATDLYAWEAGTIGYRASLSHAVTGSPLVITLSNGLSITIPLGNFYGSVSAPVPNDVYKDAPVSASITGLSGGNFENLVVSNTTPVFTTILERTDTTVVNLDATANVAEGGVVTYVATVASPVTGSPVIVTLSTGQTITIPVGSTSGILQFTAPNDVYNGANPISATITNVSGGNFENLEANPAPAVTNVIDSSDITTVNLGANPGVAENGVITYTASVVSPVTGTPVVVTLSNGQTITIPVGSTIGSVQFTAPNDVYNGANAVSTTITNVTGGNFETLVANPTPVVTSVTDSVDTTTVNLDASTSVAENGVVTYTASVTSPVTGTAVIVTLSNGQTITIPVGATNGSVQFTAPNDIYNGAAPITASITGLSGGNFENLVANPAPAVTSVTDSIDTTTVSLGASPSVSENGVVTYTASVTSAMTGAPVIVTLSNGQTITIAVGSTSGSVQFTAPNDVYTGAPAISTTITGIAGGNFESLVANPAPAITTVSDSADTTSVALSAPASSIENGEITYTASVTSPVTGAPVIVTLSNGQTITIPVGATSATVQFTVPNDFINGAQPLSTSITGVSGGNFENLVANPAPAVTTVADALDVTGINLDSLNAAFEGSSIRYTATAGTPAGTPVTVTLSNGAVIIIPAGQQSGTVFVPAPADTVYKDSGSVSVTIVSVEGGNFEQLYVSDAAVVTRIIDTPDTSTVVLSATPSVTEGGVVTYTASVSAPVTGTPVTVTLNNGQSIVIPVGQSSASVDFTAPDNVLSTNAALTNSITGVSGGNYENLVADQSSVTTAVTDDPAHQDTTSLTLSANGTVAEGGSIVYTATLSNPAGTEMKITLSNGETITIGKGQTEGSVTFAAPGDSVYVDAGTVSVTVTGTTGGDFEKLDVSATPAVTAVTDTVDTSTVTLTATPSAVEGGVVTYTASVSAPVTGSALVVTLANGQSITIPVNQSSASVDFIAPNNVLNTNTPLTNSI
ncbi:retention module-containing protein, partial [Pseudomonas japonica]